MSVFIGEWCVVRFWQDPLKDAVVTDTQLSTFAIELFWGVNFLQ
ncbi:hypothetical protein RKD27_007989 [Streptomyces sp. SAI-126]